MPAHPKRPCLGPSCPKLVTPPVNRCDECRKKFNNERARGRPGSRKVYGRRWQEARVRHLKANPLCVACLDQGNIVAATEVDHITPHRGDQSLFWDEANWQSLCKPCHSRKTAQEVHARRKQSDFDDFS